MNGDFNNQDEFNTNPQPPENSGENGSEPTQGDNNVGANSTNEDNNIAQYGGNAQYKWNYDDYQKAVDQKSKPNKKNSGFKPFLITICSVFGVALLGLAVVGVTSLAGINLFSSGIHGNSVATSSQTQGNGPSLKIASQPQTSSVSVPASGELTTEQLAQKLTPAVVGVLIYDVSSVEPTAEGSGIVMTSDGYIITNAHVISGAQVIRVVMSNGTTYGTVKVVGEDTKTDLAVLKINATGLTAATFGDSTQLKVGQDVIAIGNPGGLQLASTVTNGIVSGLNRTVGDVGSSMTYIQTNALINPGNSGGPLVNMYGQVVGINCSKISETGFEGIGFAIPISSAKPIIDDIIKNGYVTGRVQVGIQGYPLSTSDAQSYGFPSGLYVDTVDTTSDAYAKGLRAKDIITKINGISIASDDEDTVYNNFYNEESKYKVGDTVTLTVFRTDSGDTLTIAVKLSEDKGDSASSATTEQQNSDGTIGQDGSNDQNGNTDQSGITGQTSSFWNSVGQ